jgi:hypothetical protein
LWSMLMMLNLLGGNIKTVKKFMEAVVQCSCSNLALEGQGGACYYKGP